MALTELAYPNEIYLCTEVKSVETMKKIQSQLKIFHEFGRRILVTTKKKVHTNAFQSCYIDYYS